MNKHQLGAAHELLAATFLIKHGWEVYFPFMTQSRCDFIACKGKRTLKVQVKTVTKSKTGPFVYKQCRLTSGFNNKYLLEDFDLLIAVDPDGGAYAVRHKDILDYTSLCFGSNNPKYRAQAEYNTLKWFIPRRKFFN